LSGWILASSNRWMLAHYTSLADVGVYSLTEMLTSIFQVCILYPISGAYLPALMQAFAQYSNNIRNIDVYNKKIMATSMLCLSICACLGFVVGKSLLYHFLPKAYYRAIPYLLITALGNIFLMGTYFSSCSIQFYKRTTFLAGSLTCSALLTLTLSALLIPRYGLGGSVISLTSSYAGYFFMTLAYNQWLHLENKNYYIKKLL
jgi:O-antigen/teichoic acid export membrane protein